MRRIFIILGLIGLLAWPQAAVADQDPPRTVGGIKLGGLLEDYKDKLRMNTVLPIRHAETLKEVEVKEIPGFKSGLVYYGTCNQPPRILRIKLKYEQSSKKFYDKLLDRYKQRFGNPSEWRGDPFKVVIAWKWSFTDADGNSISMILLHNTEKYGQKMGNVVKLAYPDLIVDEIECYDKKHPGERGEEGDWTKDPTWDQLLPE